MKFSLYISAVQAACEAVYISGGCLVIDLIHTAEVFFYAGFIALSAERKVQDG